MNRITVVSASVALALGIAALVNVARAADPTPQQLRQEQMTRRCGDMDARMAAHLAYAETKLKLTDTQKAGFKRLSDTVRESSAPMRKLCEERFDQTQTLPERMTRMQKVADVRAESLHKLVPVMSDFYASLSLEQQKVADDLMPGMSGGKGGFGGGHGHHGGGWGGGWGGGRHGMMGPS